MVAWQTTTRRQGIAMSLIVWNMLWKTENEKKDSTWKNVEQLFALNLDYIYAKDWPVWLACDTEKSRRLSVGLFSKSIESHMLDWKMIHDQLYPGNLLITAYITQIDRSHHWQWPFFHRTRIVSRGGFPSLSVLDPNTNLLLGIRTSRTP